MAPLRRVVFDDHDRRYPAASVEIERRIGGQVADDPLADFAAGDAGPLVV